MHQESEELVCRPARQDLALEAKAPSETIVLKATISFTLSNTLAAVTAPLPPPFHTLCSLPFGCSFTFYTSLQTCHIYPYTFIFTSKEARLMLRFSFFKYLR